MAEEQNNTYPDLPVTQWIKLRNAFKSRLPSSVDWKYVQTILNLQETTARNTHRNLLLMGIIDKDGKITELANNWRVDDLYPQVCNQILENIYPNDLLHATESSLDRNMLVNWFIRRTRVGEKAAHKNAAIFEALRDGDLAKFKEKKEQPTSAQPRTGRAQPPRKTPSVAIPIEEPKESGNKPEKGTLVDTSFSPVIHIDVQIHISPESSAEQIEEIFAAIAKHLYKPQN